MDLDLDPDTLAFRNEARTWLRDNVPGQLSAMDTPEGFAQHRAWERRLAEAGWSVVSWPAEYGGRDASLLRWVLFEEEYYAASAPGRVSANGISLLGPALFAHGTEEQRARVLPRMARADDVWAQAWSEPETGSDLAAVRSRAERTGGGWRPLRHKTWR